jgi:hypothetical protein
LVLSRFSYIDKPIKGGVTMSRRSKVGLKGARGYQLNKRTTRAWRLGNMRSGSYLTGQGYKSVRHSIVERFKKLLGGGR